jgi:hypothetical protein
MVERFKWNLLAHSPRLCSTVGMSVHLAEQIRCGLPPEARLLKAVTVRLLEASERAAFDAQMAAEHYLKNATAVGQVLRYVAEYQGRWVALLVFSSAAFHLKPRDRWLHWSARQVAGRRHLLAQNSRFLVLAATGHWPNLASRLLKLSCARLAEDWRRHFGHPVLAVETFVDPQRFKGTCYRAAGWERLGATQGCQRDWQDFYTDTLHPKELWVRPLQPTALAQLRAEALPPDLAAHQKPLPPPCPVVTERLHSLWQRLRDHLTDPRQAKGKRHALACLLSLVALAVCAGCQGPHAIAEFAASLNHGQRRQLRCRPRPNTRRQCDVPGEHTFRRLLKTLNAAELQAVLVAWMAQEDPTPVQVVHLDGKVLKNAAPAPALEKPLPVDQEIPESAQKPKADQALTLVNFLTSNQRLLDQIAVPANTNEEAAVAAHWPKLNLTGVLVTADAAHTVKANARVLTQDQGADYLLPLKANQPLAYAKAQQLLTGSFPPSGPNAGQSPRPD